VTVRPAPRLVHRRCAAVVATSGAEETAAVIPLFDWRAIPSSRPGILGARAQPRSRLAVRPPPQRRASGLDGGEHGARLTPVGRSAAGAQRRPWGAGAGAAAWAMAQMKPSDSRPWPSPPLGPACRGRAACDSARSGDGGPVGDGAQRRRGLRRRGLGPLAGGCSSRPPRPAPCGRGRCRPW